MKPRLSVLTLVSLLLAGLEPAARAEPNPGAEQPVESRSAELAAGLQVERPDLEAIWEKYDEDELTLEECATLIRHYSPVVRTWGAYSLGRKGKASMPVIMEALRDPDPRVRRAGLDAIAGPVALGSGVRQKKHRMTPEIVAEAAPLIAENLKEDDPWLLDGALLAFAMTGEHGARYVPQIIKYLDTEEDWWLRDAAARAIGGLGKQHAQEAIVPLAKTFVKETHIVAQGKMKEALFRLDLHAGAAEIVPILLAALKNPPQHKHYDAWHFRGATLDVLAKVGPAARDALPTIEELMAECDRELKQDAGPAGPSSPDKKRKELENRMKRLQETLDAIKGKGK